LSTITVKAGTHDPYVWAGRKGRVSVCTGLNCNKQETKLSLG